MLDLTDLKALEFYFADHFDTLLFPVLAEHYLLRNEFSRAHKVSEIGLSHHPEFVPGLFIQARIYLEEGDLNSAEKTLKKILTMDPGHYQAHHLLADVQTKLGRAPSTLRRRYKKILEIYPGDERAREGLEKPISKEPPKAESPENLLGLSISPKLATFTLMAILKSQKLYDQALGVLSVMSGKEGADIKRIERERKELLRLLKVEE